jgi:hypothetical protein
MEHQQMKFIIIALMLLPATASYGGSRALGTNPRALGTNPRALGTNPRALGTNPRALGTNPRAQRQREIDREEIEQQERTKQ